jgi:hypothetical protein
MEKNPEQREIPEHTLEEERLDSLPRSSDSSDSQSSTIPNILLEESKTKFTSPNQLLFASLMCTVLTLGFYTNTTTSRIALVILFVTLEFVLVRRYFKNWSERRNSLSPEALRKELEITAW